MPNQRHEFQPRRRDGKCKALVGGKRSEWKHPDGRKILLV